MKPLNYLACCIMLIFTAIACANPPKKPSSSKITSNTVIAIYQDCTVYTMRTEYNFLNEATKEEIKLHISQADEEKQADVPKNLIDDSKNLEGVPGANPAMVGRRFVLRYNNGGNIVSVKLLK
jgi:hypothetical protein